MFELYNVIKMRWVEDDLMYKDLPLLSGRKPLLPPNTWLYHQQKIHFLRDCAAILSLAMERDDPNRMDQKTQQPDKEHLGRQSWELYAFAVPQTQQVPVGIARVTAPFSEQFSQSQAAGESLRHVIKVPTTLESWGAMFSMSLLKSSITACSRGCWIRLGAKRSLLTVFEMCILGLEKWMGRGGRGLCSEISCSWMYFSAILNKYAMVNVYLAGVCGYWLSIAAERRKKHRQNAEFLVVSNAVFRNKLLISCST